MNLIQKSFKTLINNINEALIGIDKKGRIIVMNNKAKKLLEINEECMGQCIRDVVDKSRLLRVIETGKKELHEKITVNGKEFIVNRVPVKVADKVEGAFAVFYDITEYNKLKRELHEDKDYIDILDTIINAFDEWIVVVDEKGYITMMSDAYKEFLNEKKPEGKHVTEVIENTRMHIVAKTGVKEIGGVQEIKGNKMIPMRIPIKKNGKVVGSVGKVMFKDISDFYSLSRKITNLEKEIQYYKSELNKERQAKYSFDSIVGNSSKIRQIKEVAKKAALTDSNILIYGESGTGKELFAHAIHNASKRCSGPFVKINCAAIPADLLESELFGYEEGAFTGAKKGGKKGKFELADGGTILLDEIGDMPLHMQAKLLRVLQEREVERVGGNVVRKVNVRIIASTNKRLEESVKNGEFREDLYYRLNVIKLTIPSLRERKEDIPDLAKALRKKIAKRLGMYVEGISKEAIDYLMTYDWPGNIRELENVIERAINLLDSDLVIKPEHLPTRLTSNKLKKYKLKSRYLKEIIEEVEKEVISECLKECGGNKNKASKILGISRAGLYNKIKQYNLEDE
ncbi:sigma-54-dependent Fis family transcriptional regulator [Caldisalinibacter kiritimatiensis]|uniref:Sigma-54 dependent transcriptional regulator n=1 Tax=Caldisalinibacter kiritimatiensis TaxID=1304284 RepID=R1CTI7_9FIRM|nr:sigma-54-dependent Fis family transcriptional regulator [Caldisalinibacter kiritimatiensis]EOC99983.1 sigma-54 dependent transcriptional regulator [Caldisalinibacter kiritimatiensis]